MLQEPGSRRTQQLLPLVPCRLSRTWDPLREAQKVCGKEGEGSAGVLGPLRRRGDVTAVRGRGGQSRDRGERMDSTVAPTCLSPVGPIAQRWWEPSVLPLALAPLRYPRMKLADALPKLTRSLLPLNRAEHYSAARLEELSVAAQNGCSKPVASCVLQQAAAPSVPTEAPYCLG